MPQVLEEQIQSFTQVHLDSQLTKDSAVAVLAAYADFENPPATLPSHFGYRKITHFTGWNQVLFVQGKEERFGLILQSLADPSTYMIAFRGTDSLYDIYEDIWATTDVFVPYRNDGRFPKNVHVASGFYSIYSSKGSSMTLSMREQLFAIFPRLPTTPRTLLLCGHSLGSTLSNLYALDLAVSMPSIRVINTTFASPRTGQRKWQTTYDTTYRLQGTTFRIANYWDIIPTLPPEILNYRHIGQQFLVSFYVDRATFPHYVSRHSMLNYQTVLDHAVDNNPQVWTGTFPDAARPGWTMRSTQPPTAIQPEWGELLARMENETLEDI